MSSQTIATPNQPITSASDYILSLFDSNDLIAVMMLRDGEPPKHHYAKAKEVASSAFMESLRKQNEAGWNIYVCMNPLSAERRIKDNIACIRTVYLDIDQNGTAALAKISQSTLVPKPHFILQSSPSKFQVIWLVDGLQPKEQEPLLDALIQEFGGDPAASDMTRVLRLPGFMNHKYETKPVVELIETNFDGLRCKLGDFKGKTVPFKKAEKIPDIIPDGERNSRLTSFAGVMRRKGASEKAILAALRETNPQCQTPLPDSELAAIAKSVSRYAPASRPPQPSPEISDEIEHPKEDEAQIQTAMQIYREVLGAGKPVRTVDFLKRFFDARVSRKYIELACTSLGVILSTAEDGWVWASAPKGGFSIKSSKILKGIVTTLGAITADTITPKRIVWLWEKRIAQKLTMLVGNPDVGKGLITYYIVACITTGQDWFDARNTLPPSEVVILSGEEDWDDTVVPRLMSAGADLSKVHHLEMITTQNGVEMERRELALDHNMKNLEDYLEAHPTIRLVVVDPISTYLGETVKMIDEQAVRARILIPLKELASRKRVAVVAVMHLNKKVELDAVYRIGGAEAFVGVARMVWACAPKPVEDGAEESDEMVMVKVKGNIVARNLKGLSYIAKVHSLEIEGEPTWVPYVEWIGEVNQTAADVMGTPKKPAHRPAEQLPAAVKWLYEYLKDGAKPLDDIESAGKAMHGFNAKTLQRARKDGGIRTFASGRRKARDGKVRDCYSCKLPAEPGDL